jgi:rhodanese-related sulfurtransferase
MTMGWSALELGGMLYDSLHNKLLALPDSTLVYPAHGAGSLCGKAISKETVSTLGQQRKLNYALKPMTRDAFVKVVTADQPDAPAYFTYDAVLNSQERPTLDQALQQEMNPLSLDEVLALQAGGAQILDTRDPGEFAAAHLAGSINIGLGGQYATWVGTILNHDHPIVILAAPGRETEAAIRLGRIGFDHIAGFLAGGLNALASRPDLTAATQRLSAPFAAELLAAPNPPLLLDVRGPREREQKQIAGSLGIPLNHLIEQLHQLPKDRPLLVHCAGGYRSSIAASMLQAFGYENVSELAGGIAAWEAAGFEVNTGKPE